MSRHLYTRVTLACVLAVLLSTVVNGARPQAAVSATADTSHRSPREPIGTLHRQTATFYSDVETPSPDFTTWIEGQLIRVDIPTNWRELPGSNAVTFAPDGAYGNVGTKSIFTHGVALGLARNDKHDLRLTTGDFVDAYVFDGLGTGRISTNRAVLIAGRPGLDTVMTTRSPATGASQRVEVFTTLLRDGTLFYVLAISPTDCQAAYAATFRHVVESIAIMDCDGCARS
jgi:hypothetical protein